MRWFQLLLTVAGAVVIGFLLLPLLALFLRVSPGDLISALGSGVALDALVVTLKTSAIAHLLILGFGTPAAYLLATKGWKGRSAAVALIELPLVLPPVVAGIALLSVFGRLGLLGETMDVLGISISFTQTAVVLAVVFVASPFFIRQAIVAFEGVDTGLLEAARTLRASPWRVFSRVALPLASRGLAAGSALAFVRGLGEFGATIIFAGSFRGVTQTLPLAIYGELDQDFEAAIAISVLLVLISVAILTAIRWVPSWNPFTSTSH
ncbi:MAG: molybdate ABC transporter permease subunit [Actinomycetota bacterium]|nr:molybdate ABC transporter permease subunit [Actinomycetota bacterium]